MIMAIFMGFIFTIFTYVQTIGNLKIDVFPDFIGYLILFWVVNKYKNQLRMAKQWKPVYLILAIVSFIYMIADYSGMIIEDQMLNFIVRMSLTLAKILSLYAIIMSLEDFEKNSSQIIKSGRIKTTFLIFALTVIIDLFGGFVGNNTLILLLYLVNIGSSLLMMIFLFIAAINDTDTQQIKKTNSKSSVKAGFKELSKEDISKLNTKKDPIEADNSNVSTSKAERNSLENPKKKRTGYRHRKK